MSVERYGRFELQLFNVKAGLCAFVYRPPKSEDFDLFVLTKSSRFWPGFLIKLCSNKALCNSIKRYVISENGADPFHFV